MEHYRTWDQNLTFINTFFYNKFKSNEGWDNQKKYHDKLNELIKNIVYSAQNYQELILDQTNYLLEDIDRSNGLLSAGILTSFVSAILAVYFGFQAFQRKIKY